MSYFSSPETVIDHDSEEMTAAHDALYQDLPDVPCPEEQDEILIISQSDPLQVQSMIQMECREEAHVSLGERVNTEEHLDDVEDDLISERSLGDQYSHHPTHIVVCGIKCTRRQVGILAAAFCGIYGGSIMAPMKFAPPDAKGTGYLISFSTGAMIVTGVLWVFRYLYLIYCCRSIHMAYRALPSFYVRDMWLPGGTAGLLWSIGNFFSLISVNILGEGVGYPLVQTSILVAGLWGIFYFKEVTGAVRITQWLFSSLLTISGILLLSYEHHHARVRP